MICKTIQIGNRELSIETGRMAKQAMGAVVVRYGDTMILVTATANLSQAVQQDFFPLQVEYRERSYAAGKIPGGFFKREGRPSEKEILSARLIDRPIRPLFPEGYHCDTQIIANVISSDRENPADVLGVIGASAALCISEIPFLGPIAGVRVGRLDGNLVLNPTWAELEKSELDIVVAGNEESVVMVEGESKEIQEQVLVDAIEFAHSAIRTLIDFQKQLILEIQPVKHPLVPIEKPTGLETIVTERSMAMLPQWRELGLVSKHQRADSISLFTQTLQKELAETFPDSGLLIQSLVDDLVKADVRDQIITLGRRVDGRGLTEIRPITCEVGVLPRAHGSALFTRGETQSLGSVTLGTKYDEQIIDDIDREESTKKFMLHYNFPPFSVGEVRPLRGTGRREIGHGNLAERALRTQIPSEEDFPYTVRVVSDILESNGSSSMATVCAGSLAFMDAGIPVKKTVAGIAMGLIKDGDQTLILTDILGAEDHYGDMDFKVAGTVDGITAIQMDLKVRGISTAVMRTALEQAHRGRLEIIRIMEATLAQPRPNLSPYAPKMITIKIDVESIGEVIGPGGKNIRSIQAATGSTIEIGEDGTVFISAPDMESGERARNIIWGITTQPEEGAVYTGTVKRLESYGAFVEILPGKEGLLHISEVAWQRTPDINQVMKLGDVVKVKLKKIAAPGRFELSMRELMEKPADYHESPSRGERSSNHSGFNSRGHHRPRDRR